MRAKYSLLMGLLLLILAVACDSPTGRVEVADITGADSESMPDTQAFDSRDGKTDQLADQSIDQSPPDAGVDITLESDGLQEVEQPVDPALLDDDNDGLTNAEEQKLSTDPTKPDSDGDGFADGWEVAKGTDPLDPNDKPGLDLPPGTPYLLRLTRIVKPQAITLFVTPAKVPPMLLFVDGLSDGVADTVTLVGGIGELANPGADDAVGTADDVYGLLLSSIDPKSGEFLINLNGSLTEQTLLTAEDTLSLDLTGVNELTDGVVLNVSKAVIDGVLSKDLQWVNSGRITGELTSSDIEQLIEQVDLSIPLTPKQLLALLDPDKNGIVEVEFELEGQRTQVSGFVVRKKKQDPEPRKPGKCCPDGLKVGDPIDSALLIQDQGIQPDEESLAALFIEALLTDPQVDIVATMRVQPDGTRNYLALAIREIDGSPQRQEVEFQRVRKAGLTSYKILRVEGQNPLALLGDPQSDALINMFSTIEEIFGTGLNPNKLSLPSLGYLTADDQRLSFLEPADVSFPLAYERLAQIFDDPRTGDLVVLRKPYASTTPGQHGNLDSVQSRIPLVLLGAGVKNANNFVPGPNDPYELRTLSDGSQALYYKGTGRQVDIAPTIAAALRLKKTTGVNRQGYLSDKVYLKWQDGEPLKQVFVSDPETAPQPLARYAVILINDGLTSMELNHEVQNKQFDVPGWRALIKNGLTFTGGAISNYPSNTYPGHNTVGCGAWSGHHGIIDNHFYLREFDATQDPLNRLVNTSFLLGSAHTGLPIETLHEAVHRTFGIFDPDNKTGALTISVNDPSSRGADFSTIESDSPLEMTFANDKPETVTIGGTEYPLPVVAPTDVKGIADNLLVKTVAQIYQNPDLPAPRYAIINLPTTDGAGHSYGPHGTPARDKGYKLTSQRIGLIMKVFEGLCLPKGDPNCTPFLDQALIVLTSDHGMALQDKTRGKGGVTDKLDLAGLSYRKSGAFIYIKTLMLKLSAQSFKKGVEATFSATILDGDSQHIGIDRPLGGASLKIVSGDSVKTLVADADGKLSLTFTPTGDKIEFEVTAEGYNPHTRTILTD